MFIKNSCSHISKKQEVLTYSFGKIIEKYYGNSSFLIKLHTYSLQLYLKLRKTSLHYVSKILPTSNKQLFQFISSQCSTYRETRQSVVTSKMCEKHLWKNIFQILTVPHFFHTFCYKTQLFHKWNVELKWVNLLISNLPIF